MLGGRRSAGADRSEAQLPAAQHTRKAEAVSKRNGPAIFAQAGPFFISSKLRRTANQVTAQQAVARPTQPKLRATDSRYCGSLTRSSAGSGHYSENSLLSVDSRAPFSDMGVLLKEHRGHRVFCYSGNGRGDAASAPRPFSRGERACRAGTRTGGLPRLVQRPQIAGPSMRAISVDRISSKNTGAKQTQDYCGALNEGSGRRKRGYQNGVSSEHD
jgi:hypothetical protein